MVKVTVYMADWCPWCHKVTDFLKENKVEFEEKNVENREYAQESMEKSGQAGIPVTVIGEEVVVGFDVAKLKELLKLE
jgi:alkyl hydroperoxide reductase subunit F